MHQDLTEIDAALLAGNESIRAVATRFRVNRSSLTRHHASHLRQRLARVNDRQREDLVTQYRQWQEELREKAMGMLEKADKLIDKGSASALRGAASVIREVRNLHRDVAVGLGAIGDAKRKEEATVNVGRAVIVCPPSLPPGSPCNLDADYWRSQGFTGPDEDDPPAPVPALPPATIESVPSAGDEDDPGPLESTG